MKNPLIAGTILGVVCVAPAFAQIDSREGIALQNQIAELRQELQAVQQGSAPPQPYPQQAYAPPVGPPGGGDTSADLVVRVSALEEQNRQLQGRVDDLANQLQRQHDDLTKQIGDIAFKLGQGSPAAAAAASEPALPPETAGTAAPRVIPPPKAPPAPRRTAELALREANSAMIRHDYPAAAAAAREAMQGGHGATTSSAQFVLARAEGAQHQFKESAADFYQAYNHAPRSPAAPVALLGVANALIAMNDGRDACQALAKLQAEFPGSASVKAGAASARKRAACAR